MRLSPPAVLAALWAALFAASSAYWAAGGTAGVHTVAKTLADRALAREPGFVAILWVAALVKLALAGLALCLARTWGRRATRLLRIAGWATGGALALYGVFGLVKAGLMSAGVLDVPADLGEEALSWYLLLWEPVWLVGGLLFLAAVRRMPRPLTPR